MKILHVCPLYFPSLGGNQVHIQTISEQLAAQGDEVHVFTAQAMERYQYDAPDPAMAPLKPYEVVNGVHVHRFPVNYFRSSFVKKLMKVRGGYRIIKTFIGDAMEYWNMGPCVSGLPAAIGRLNPDLLLAVMENSFTTYQCYLAQKRFAIPLVFMPITHISDQRLFHEFVKKIYAASDALIACTDFEKNVLVQRGAKAEKIRTVPLGMPSRLIDGDGVESVRRVFKIQNKPTVSFIGRLAFHKGVEILFDAMKIVWQKNPETQFLLAGKEEKLFGPTLEKCFARMTAEEKARMVYIKNFRDRQKKDLYHASDVVVMASNVDCFGLVYLEAWSCSKPVIACRHTPQETIIDDGQNGLLVRYGDADDLARAILKLLDNEPLRIRMGKAGHDKLLKEYDLSQYTMKLRNVYREIGNRNSRHK